MRRKYPDLAIVGVATDPEPDRAGILAFATAERATFPIAWDPGRVVANAVPPPAYQSLVILDRRGVVVHTHVGTHEGVWEEVEAKVKVLLEAAR